MKKACKKSKKQTMLKAQLLVSTTSEDIPREFVMNDKVAERKALRGRLLRNIVALGELTQMPKTSEVGKLFFYEAIKLEVSNLKDLDSESSYSVSDLSTTENDTYYGGVEADNPRKVSRTRLLANISTLIELREINKTSEEGKRIFWEAIKIETKTLKKLEECNGSKVRDPEIHNDFNKVPSEQATTVSATRTTKWSDTDHNPSKEPTTLLPTTAKLSHSNISDYNPSTGTLPLSSSPSSEKEKKTSEIKSRNRVRSLLSLRRLCKPMVSQTEWLRSDEEGQSQNNHMMEMVFFCTEAETNSRHQN